MIALAVIPFYIGLPYLSGLAFLVFLSALLGVSFKQAVIASNQNTNMTMSSENRSQAA